MNKIYIGIITQDDKKNIEELTSVAHYFDGLAATDHKSKDGTYELLQSRAGAGFVEQIPYFGHHSHSMNHFLFNTKIEIGDWILLRDSNERINEDFAKNIRTFVDMLESNSVNTVYQYSKLLLFKRFPQQYFYSTPHWGLNGARPGMIQIEKANIFSNDEEYCYSVRNKNRDKYHFVGAYMRYYLILDSNHSLLGLEKNIPAGGDLQKSFVEREEIRIGFIKSLINNNYPCSVAGVKMLLDHSRLTGLPQWAVPFFSKEKILNDMYRHYFLGLEDFNDDHVWNNMVKI